MHDELIAARQPRERYHIDARIGTHLTPNGRLRLGVWLTDLGNVIRVKAPEGAVNCSIQSIEPMTMEVVS